MTYRETFGIPNPSKITGAIANTSKNAGNAVGNAAGNAGSAAANAGSAAANAGKTAGNAVANTGKGLGNSIKTKVLSPIGNFFKKIWGWFKWVLSACCCICVLCSCFFLGIPQMAMSAMK
jgi:hypothetical protein